ncbi:MAG: TIGR01459 family HAD-type hydrolase [Candidatus Tokpelaia sp.]|uniref:TIGR01459 family HAD-type hydrolase n=1 Tax=Candidatus Tokpelaia sp. TaxID=2233777 RepID=UPI00123A98D6|nr:TIGR01459 family HAD-type hydrolase [Candidatus Tokpelaia sp.]KAA6205244.1 MAG: TIGR01459 family HAD-type hydrolase [Candidatus Tokpelaia sp.]KAA6207457.1 MAG: TIGR01459 family HAD-type hydrolase [Candidatus Tokpelaia sp.]KAA6405708.1 TIGR01459 family HAD-type hydrolase [Candidatus Tokpelaia sp.]
MALHPVTHLAEIDKQYDIILSDIWGVLHNGVRVYPAAKAALAKARAKGKIIILITNSPRPAADVIAQLTGFGLTPGSYDGIITSGDVTRSLIEQAPKRLFHIGPERDLSLLAGLSCELVEDYEAQAVLCTGLFHETEESPEDYRPLLQKLRGRNLPFICANPDIVVHIGGRELWCAGALAQIYTQLGGRTLIAGKPHAPIYEAAYAQAAARLGLAGSKAVDKSRILAIGDGLMTDIKGADNQGLDCLFIAGGIHIRDYGTGSPGGINAAKLTAFMARHGYHPQYFMPALA